MTHTITTTKEDSNLPDREDRNYMTFAQDIYYVFGADAYRYIITASRQQMPTGKFPLVLAKVVSHISPEKSTKLEISKTYNLSVDKINIDPITTLASKESVSQNMVWLPAFIYDVADCSIANDLICGAANMHKKNEPGHFEDELVSLCEKWLSDTQRQELAYNI